MPTNTTGLPMQPHPGSFGAIRKHDRHEGVDLYAPDGTVICAAEDGKVARVMPFTGPAAGFPWWLDTDAVLVEGASGVIVYGEIIPVVREGDAVVAGQAIGHVTRVLKVDKGRPMSMLHIELRTPGTREWTTWPLDIPQPENLLDPTPFLMASALNVLKDRF